MLYEVVALLLNYKGAQKLTVDLLEVVGKRKETKLNTGKLDKKMKEVIECSASCLFNSVSLIWSKHINVEARIDGDCEEDNARRKYMAQERAMNGMFVSADSVPDQEVNDDSESVEIGKSTVEVISL